MNTCTRCSDVVRVSHGFARRRLVPGPVPIGKPCRDKRAESGGVRSAGFLARRALLQSQLEFISILAVVDDDSRAVPDVSPRTDADRAAVPQSMVVYLAVLDGADVLYLEKVGGRWRCR